MSSCIIKRLNRYFIGILVASVCFHEIFIVTEKKLQVMPFRIPCQSEKISNLKGKILELVLDLSYHVGPKPRSQYNETFKGEKQE